MNRMKVYCIRVTFHQSVRKNQGHQSESRRDNQCADRKCNLLLSKVEKERKKNEGYLDVWWRETRQEKQKEKENKVRGCVYDETETSKLTFFFY